MAVPKRRLSKTRGLKRSTHYKITLAKPIKENGEWRMPHRMNSNGEYSRLND